MRFGQGGGGGGILGRYVPPSPTPAQPYFPAALRVEGHPDIRGVGEAGDSLSEDTPRLPALRAVVWPSTQTPSEILGAPSRRVGLQVVPGGRKTDLSLIQPPQTHRGPAICRLDLGRVL